MRAAGQRNVKILDFGSTRVLDLAEGRTASPFSALYFAPEQVNRGAVDERTDVWALGAVLFELLVGRPPFGGGSATAASAIVNDAAPRLRTLRREIPLGLEKIVLKALGVDPPDRIQAAAELGVAPRSVRYGTAGIFAQTAHRGGESLRSHFSKNQRDELLGVGRDSHRFPGRWRCRSASAGSCPHWRSAQFLSRSLSSGGCARVDYALFVLGSARSCAF